VAVVAWVRGGRSRSTRSITPTPARSGRTPRSPPPPPAAAVGAAVVEVSLKWQLRVTKGESAPPPVALLRADTAATNCRPLPPPPLPPLLLLCGGGGRVFCGALLSTLALISSTSAGSQCCR